jgi:uncharacterized protein YdhG (YjbR/CyaY superfamily)
MKKAKSRTRSTGKSRAARKNPPKTIDQYLAAVPEPARTTLKKLRAALRSALPREATETISYRIPAFKHNGILVWFAAFSTHCSLFPTAAVIEAHKAALKRYKLAKGTIQFPIDKPLSAALVKKLVKTRLVQIESKQRK